jgi:hypothetical protein
MIQIEQSGTFISPVFTGSAQDLDRLRAQYERQHCLRFLGFLGPSLLHIIQQRINDAEFYERVHEGIGPNKELCMRDDNPITNLLYFLLNNPRLLDLIRQLTQSGPIGSFSGRVYRFVPGSGHHDAWHDDLGEHRMIGISVNLSDDVYSGGVLQIRDRKSRELVHEVANIGRGDALIFRLADHLQHRVTEVEGTAPKTAFAGWFRSEPDFLSLVKQQREFCEGRGPDSPPEPPPRLADDPEPRLIHG